MMLHPTIPTSLLLLLFSYLATARPDAAQITAAPAQPDDGFSSSLIGDLTPTPLETSIFTKVFGSDYWPFVSTDAAGQNAYVPPAGIIPTGTPQSEGSFFAQTTNAGNPPLSIVQSPSSNNALPSNIASPTQLSAVTASTTMPMQTGNMAVGRVRTSQGLAGPAALVLGAAVVVAGAIL